MRVGVGVGVECSQLEGCGVGWDGGRGGSGEVGVGGWGVGAVYSCHARLWSYGYRASRPCNAGTEHVGFSPTRQTLLVASSAKLREELKRVA